MPRHYYGKNQKIPKLDSDECERLPVSIATQCLGKQCVNYAGVECDPRLVLLCADGTSADLDVPPYVGTSSYAMRGRVCTGGAKDELVNIETEVLRPGVSFAMLIALSGRFGDLPHKINSPESTQHVFTFSKSID